MRFLSSRLGITKIVVAILIVIVASASVAISYAITQHLIQNNSPTPTASPKPTVSPSPTSPFPVTPEPTPTPTPTGSAHPTPTPTPELTTQEKIRNSVMSYVKSNHPETAQFMKDLVWTGGRVTPPNIVGAETYMYYDQGWNVTINYPVVPKPHLQHCGRLLILIYWHSIQNYLERYLAKRNHQRNKQRLRPIITDYCIESLCKGPIRSASNRVKRGFAREIFSRLEVQITLLHLMFAK